MRLNCIPLEVSDKKIQIDVDLEGNKPFCVVYCEGKAKITFLPEHGETRVIMHQGKVKRVRWEEGEDF